MLGKAFYRRSHLSAAGGNDAKNSVMRPRDGKAMKEKLVPPGIEQNLRILLGSLRSSCPSVTCSEEDGRVRTAGWAILSAISECGRS